MPRFTEDIRRRYAGIIMLSFAGIGVICLAWTVAAVLYGLVVNRDGEPYSLTASGDPLKFWLKVGPGAVYGTFTFAGALMNYWLLRRFRASKEPVAFRRKR